MGNFCTRKLCENACTLQAVRFLLGKGFDFAKLKTQNIVFKTFTFSTTLFLTSTSNIE